MKISSSYLPRNTSIAIKNRDAYFLQTQPADIFQNKTPQEISFTGFSLRLGIKRKIKWLLNILPWIKLTKYDTPDIKQIRHEVLGAGRNIQPTIKDNSPQRQQLREKIIQHFLQARKEVKAEKNCYVVLGLPGSGKSTLSDFIANKEKAFHIDFDAIKFKIPEYRENQRLDYIVSRETTSIRKKLLSRVMQKGYNFAIEDCGFSLKGTLKLLQKIKKEGYKIHIIMIDLPIEECLKRAMTRFAETNRFTDPFIYRLHSHKLPRNYKKLLESYPEYFESHRVVSSDVPKGEEFKTVA